MGGLGTAPFPEDPSGVITSPSLSVPTFGRRTWTTALPRNSVLIFRVPVEGGQRRQPARNALLAKQPLPFSWGHGSLCDLALAVSSYSSLDQSQHPMTTIRVLNNGHGPRQHMGLPSQHGGNPFDVRVC
jgi:hypothetical protein